MSLIEYTMLGKIDKVKQSIERLRAFEPEDGYHLAFSGGKDSVEENPCKPDHRLDDGGCMGIYTR